MTWAGWVTVAVVRQSNRTHATGSHATGSDVTGSDVTGSHLIGSRVSGVLLAAGAGSRMGAPKADLVVDGRRLVERAVAALAGGGCDEVVVVARPDAAPVPRARTVVNPAPGRGMRSSLVLGLAAAGGDGVAVLLVDTPGIDAEAIRAVVDRWRADPARIAVAGFAGRRAHPIVMAASRWPAAVARAGADEGARRYLDGHPHLVDEVDVVGDPSDLDEPADLLAWRAGAVQRRT